MGEGLTAVEIYCDLARTQSKFLMGAVSPHPQPFSQREKGVLDGPTKDLSPRLSYKHILIDLRRITQNDEADVAHVLL